MASPGDPSRWLRQDDHLYQKGEWDSGMWMAEGGELMASGYWPHEKKINMEDHKKLRILIFLLINENYK